MRSPEKYILKKSCQIEDGSGKKNRSSHELEGLKVHEMFFNGLLYVVITAIQNTY